MLLLIFCFTYIRTPQNIYIYSEGYHQILLRKELTFSPLSSTEHTSLTCGDASGPGNSLHLCVLPESVSVFSVWVQGQVGGRGGHGSHRLRAALAEVRQLILKSFNTKPSIPEEQRTALQDNRQQHTEIFTDNQTTWQQTHTGPVLGVKHYK